MACLTCPLPADPAYIDQLRREAVKLATPEPTRQGPSAEPAVRDPIQGRTAKANPHEATALHELEKALDTKNVPEEMRPAVREEARKQLDVRMAMGKPVKIAIYDPEAPSCEAQRAVQLPQQQHREHSRRR